MILPDSFVDSLPRILRNAGPFAVPSPVAGKVAIRTVVEWSEWNDLFRSINSPHLVQAPAYAYAKQETAHWHVSRLVFESHGSPVAICHALEKRLLGIRLVSRINRGPMFIEPDPSPSTIQAVFGEIRARYQLGRGGILSIAPALADTPDHASMLAGLGFRSRGLPGWCSSVVNVEQDEDALRKNLDRNWRSRLRIAEKSGLVLSVLQSTDSFEWVFEQHRQHMIAKKFRGPSVNFLRSFCAYHPEDCFAFVASFEGNPIAGLAVARFGGTAEGLVLCCDAGRRFNSGNYLLWNAMLEMKRRGCVRWDLGGHGYTPGKYKHFKEGMRGNEYRLLGEWVSY